MASLAYLLCSFLSIFINFESCYVDYKQPPHVKERTALFVFGDSPFDPGNNVYVKTSKKIDSMYWPYGETFFHHTTGRYSDGRIVPDFVATFAGLPMLPPYLKPAPHVFTDGANFASAGAHVLPNMSTYIDFPTQIKYFKDVVELLNKEFGDAETQRVVTNAVYLFSIGGVDYTDFINDYPDATEASMRAFVKLVIGNLYNDLLEITSVGAKKFALQNVGLIGCVPISRLSDGQCTEKQNEMAREHNKALVQVMKRLEREDLKEGKEACCGGGPFRGKVICGGDGVYEFELCKNPFEYVWWDLGHNTEGVNVQLAHSMWEGGPQNLTISYTVQQLFLS